MLVRASALVATAIGAGMILQSGWSGLPAPTSAVGADGGRAAAMQAPADLSAARVPVSPAGSHGSSFAPSGQPVVSLLNIRSPMKFGDFLWNDAGVPEGDLWVRVDLKRQLISVFRAGHEIGTAVILYGAENKPTPAGDFAILEKRREHHSTLYDAPMPFMLRLTKDGVAIHGSAVRYGSATHGCIGVPLPFARRLYDEASTGERVSILT